MIGDLVWSGGFVWCQFINGSFYLCDGDVWVHGHGVWIVCVWDIAEICWWWGWDEDFAQHVPFLIVGCCFAFQCGNVCVSGCGVEVFVDFPYTVFIRFTYEFLPGVTLAFVHFAVKASSILLPFDLIFLSSIFVKSSSGSLSLLP